MGFDDRFFRARRGELDPELFLSTLPAVPAEEAHGSGRRRVPPVEAPPFRSLAREIFSIVFGQQRQRPVAHSVRFLIPQPHRLDVFVDGGVEVHAGGKHPDEIDGLLGVHLHQCFAGGGFGQVETSPEGGVVPLEGSNWAQGNAVQGDRIAGRRHPVIFAGHRSERSAALNNAAEDRPGQHLCNEIRMALTRSSSWKEHRLANRLDADGTLYTVDLVARKATGVEGWKVTVVFLPRDGGAEVTAELPNAASTAEVRRLASHLEGADAELLRVLEEAR